MGSPSFKHSDVQRAVKAVKAGGETVSGVEFDPDGTFRVLTGGKRAVERLTALQIWERDHGDRAA